MFEEGQWPSQKHPAASSLFHQKKNSQKPHASRFIPPAPLRYQTQLSIPPLALPTLTLLPSPPPRHRQPLPPPPPHNTPQFRHPLLPFARIAPVAPIRHLLPIEWPPAIDLERIEVQLRLDDVGVHAVDSRRGEKFARAPVGGDTRVVDAFPDVVEGSELAS